ncbi:hypothetical protein G6F56_013453 [Rhizopus delemar]|nr:hypothetical protein G6F56_013453 [Rhizopus delemar]
MLLQDTEPLLPSTLLMTRNGSYWNIIPGSSQRIVRVDCIGDVVNEEVGQLCKDKDHTRAVTDTAVNENENILLPRTETSQEASEKQAPTSSAFNGNEDYTDSSSVENEEAEAVPQATAIFNPYKDLSRFETAEDGNIYKLFDIYQAEATKLSNVGLMKIETHLHEILSLTNIIIYS